MPQQSGATAVADPYAEFGGQAQASDPYAEFGGQAGAAPPPEALPGNGSPLDYGFARSAVHAAGVPTSMDELKAVSAATRPTTAVDAFRHPDAATIADAVGNAVVGPAYQPAKNLGKAIYRYGKLGAQEFAAGNPGAGTLDAATAATVPFGGPTVRDAAEQFKHKNYAGAAGTLTGLIGSYLVPGRVGEATEAADRAADAEIAGVRIPVNREVMNPDAAMPKIVKGMPLPRNPLARQAAEQQALGKQAITNVAQEVADQSGAVAPRMNPEAGLENIGKAARAVEAKGAEQYGQLDQILKDPKVMAITYLQPVVEKAQDMIGDLVDTERLAKDPSYGSELRADLTKLATGGQVNQPFRTVQKARSALLDLARNSKYSNPQQAAAAGKLAAEMTGAMEDALTNSGNPKALAIWKDANAKWAQKYALDSVADELAHAMPGQSVSTQKAGILGKIGAKPRSRTLNGEALLSGIEKLDKEGDLARAFPDSAHRQALKDVAQILSRVGDPNKTQGFMGKMMMLGAVSAPVMLAAGGSGGRYLPLIGGVYVLSAAMKHPLGAQWAAQFLKALPGSPQASFYASRVAQIAQQQIEEQQQIKTYNGAQYKFDSGANVWRRQDAQR